MKIAVLLESTTDCLAIESSLLLLPKGSFQGPALLVTNLLAPALDRGLEGATFLRRDGTACGPEAVRSRTTLAARTRRGVGFQASCLHVVPGPLAGPTLAAGVSLRSSFQRADAGFNGSIV